MTLTGPAAKDSQFNSNTPGRVAKPVLPQTFELVGRDSNGNVVVKYGFQLKQWYVNRGDHNYYSYDSTLSWCNNIGYRLPHVKDLTNSICAGPWSSPSCQSSVGATPPSNGNNYQRIIAAGFFSEWVIWTIMVVINKTIITTGRLILQIWEGIFPSTQIIIISIRIPAIYYSEVFVLYLSFGQKRTIEINTNN